MKCPFKPKRRLNGNQPGQTRERLAVLINKLVHEKWGKGFECWPEDISRNAPVYLKSGMDGISWETPIRKYGSIYSGYRVFSWQGMGTILKQPKHKLSDDGELSGGI
jgi:hypothetical protein